VRIQVTGGYTGEVSGRVRDRPFGRTPADLSLADIKVCLVKVGDPVPTRTGGSWVTPTSVAYPLPGEAIVTLAVGVAIPLGRYWFYALPSISPLSIPVRASNEQVEVV
jgi:hypothetical protein